MTEEYVWKEATGKLAVLDTKPNHNIIFHNGGKQVGALDFNGPEMMFSGDADESAKLFFDFIAKSFKARLEQERADERNSWPAEMEAMERQVNILTDALAEQPAQQEPCGWQFFQDGKWHNGMKNNDHHRELMKAAGVPVRDVYPSPQAQPKENTWKP